MILFSPAYLFVTGNNFFTYLKLAESVIFNYLRLKSHTYEKCRFLFPFPAPLNQNWLQLSSLCLNKPSPVILAEFEKQSLCVSILPN